MGFDEKWVNQSDMLLNRIHKNLKKLVPWSKREDITCYRLYDRDIPEIPLAVDWYDGRLHIALFEHAAATAEDRDAWIRYLSGRLAAQLDVLPANVFLKIRRRAAGGTQYKALDAKQQLISVKEGGLSFLVNLTDYVDTGLFLDHRILRRMVMQEAQGKRFLNLFAYTGAFSVYAAAGKAASTTTVDLSNTYLDWAEKNMRKNGFAGPQHHYLRGDILSALTQNQALETYDLILVDPPTISKSKAMAHDLDIQRDHPTLLNGALRHLSPGGTIYFSNNLKKFKLQRDAVDCDDIVEISDKTRPFDFRSPFVHHSFRLRTRG